MHSDEKIKDRIRKLLNVARNDAATEGEIENALRFAQALLDKHHLREEDLVDEPQDQYAEIAGAERRRVFASVGSKIYTWEGLLSVFVGQLVGGVGVYTDHRETIARDLRGLAIRGKSGRIQSGKRFCFYGIAEDALLAAEIFGELRMTIAAMARLKFGNCYRGDGAAYCEGFVHGLTQQMRERDRQSRIAAAGNSRALILLDRRADLIAFKESAAEAWLKGQGIDLATRRRTGSGASDEAWLEGKTDGLNSEVHTTRRGKLCGN